MITLSELIEKYLKETPYLEEGLSQGLINTSALARQLQPRIEKVLYKPVTKGAITVSLIRYAQKLTKKAKTGMTQLPKLGNITVRSELVEYTYAKSPTLNNKQNSLLSEIAQEQESTFLMFTEGVQETTYLASQKLIPLFESVFRGEHLKSKIEDLCAVTLILPPETVDQPGVYYQILKILAWNDINVIEVLSSMTELTIILRKNQIDRAFSAISNMNHLFN